VSEEDFVKSFSARLHVASDNSSSTQASQTKFTDSSDNFCPTQRQGKELRLNSQVWKGWNQKSLEALWVNFKK
jgi:hypothetical protein